MGYFDAAIIAKTNDLEHHGIKGQRWGVRRFQNYDGTRIGASKKTKPSTKKPSTKKPKHDFQDHSASYSQRGETYGMLGLSLAGLGLSTLGNVSLASIGMISPHMALASLMTAVGTVTYGTMAVTGEVNNAIATNKEKKFAKERAQNPVDKKTGFHKKTKEMTPEEDMERVNPGYKNWDLNTKNNCFLCTMTMELRRRGYDVQAKKATEGYDADELVKDYFKGAKPKQQEGSMTDAQILNMYNKGVTPYISHADKKKMVSNAIAEVESQKDGARGQMTCVWDGTASGHAFAYANEGGKLVIYDSQANKRYEGSKAEAYLKKCSQINVTRLDNCQLDTKYIKEVAG